MSVKIKFFLENIKIWGHMFENSFLLSYMPSDYIGSQVQKIQFYFWYKLLLLVYCYYDLLIKNSESFLSPLVLIWVNKWINKLVN